MSKKMSRMVASKIMEEDDRPQWTSISEMNDGSELLFFKLKFSSWESSGKFHKNVNPTEKIKYRGKLAKEENREFDVTQLFLENSLENEIDSTFDSATGHAEVIIPVTFQKIIRKFLKLH